MDRDRLLEKCFISERGSVIQRGRPFSVGEENGTVSKERKWTEKRVVGHE